MNKVKLDKIIFGDAAIPFIGGPCVIESRDHCFGIAERITEISSSKFELYFNSVVGLGVSKRNLVKIS